MRDVKKAIQEGWDIVRSEEDLDLDALEIMDLYNLLQAYVEKSDSFDAELTALHDAFLVGVVFGREGKRS